MNKTTFKSNRKPLAKALGIGLSALIGLASVLPTYAGPLTTQKGQQQQQRLSAQQKAQQQQYALQQKYAELKPEGPGITDRGDVLLVMPNPTAQGEDIKKALDESHGTIVGRLGTGDMTVFIIQAEHGKAAQLQKKLASDSKDFSAVDLNRQHKADYAPSPAPAQFSDSWHLFRMHIPDAWDTLFAHHAPFAYPIAVLDSGLQNGDVSLSDHGADCITKPANDALSLFNKLGGYGVVGFVESIFEDNSIKGNIKEIQKAGNYIETLTMGIGDTHGHGTWVASVAASGMYHKNGSIGVNPITSVFPIRIATGKAGTEIHTDELAEVTAFMVLSQKLGTRVVNISYGDVYDTSAKVLHKMMKYFHNTQGGLIFCSAGNDGKVLSNANLPYLIVVSAMEKTDQTDPTQANKIILANKATNGSFDSNYGTPVDFTAPGSVIDTENNKGTYDQVYGTSFSSPICASVASMVWTINPSLTNDQVEAILRASCENTTSGWNPQFGWGMPNADKAVKMAAGG